MAWRYEPKSPANEADVTLSQYHNQLRVAELRNQLEVDVDKPPATPGRFSVRRLIEFIKSGVHGGRKPDGDAAPPNTSGGV